MEYKMDFLWNENEKKTMDISPFSTLLFFFFSRRFAVTVLQKRIEWTNTKNFNTSRENNSVRTHTTTNAT